MIGLIEVLSFSRAQDMSNYKPRYMLESDNHRLMYSEKWGTAYACHILSHELGQFLKHTHIGSEGFKRYRAWFEHYVSWENPENCELKHAWILQEQCSIDLELFEEGEIEHMRTWGVINVVVDEGKVYISFRKPDEFMT
jgi:hypothetical protein